MAIAVKTGHSRETVAARIKTGEVNFATSQVVHASTEPNPRYQNNKRWVMDDDR